MKRLNYLEEGLRVGDLLHHVITGESFVVVGISKRKVPFPIYLRKPSTELRCESDFVTAEGFARLVDKNPTYTMAPITIEQTPHMGQSMTRMCIFTEDFIT